MKNLFITVLAMVLAVPTFAQHITESPISYKKRLTALFSGKSNVITMTLQREFDVNKTDTLYSLMVAVAETDVDVSNVSIGFTSFAAGGLRGLATSTSADIKAETKTAIVKLDKEKFQQLYKCVSDVWKAAGTMAALKKEVNALCTCGVEGIQFGGEYIPDAMEKQKFYFQLDGASFSMPRPEFEEVYKKVLEFKKEFEKK
jgi:hypothetical protein